MMETVDLLQLADRNGITIDNFKISGKSLAIEIDGDYYIALNNHLSEKELKEVIAHELGHCFTNGFYSPYTAIENIRKIETTANRWAYKKLLPPEKVQELASREICYYWEIAEETNLSVEFVKKAIEYYVLTGCLKAPAC